jgi:hypothetical protein
MWHAWERSGNFTGFYLESPKERDYLKDKGIDGIRMVVREIGLGSVDTKRKNEIRK